MAQAAKSENGESSKGQALVLARWTLVLGILSIPPFPFAFLTGISAIFIGRKAIHAIRSGQPPYRGRAAALTGIMLGVLSVLLTIVLIILIFTGLLRP